MEIWMEHKTSQTLICQWTDDSFEILGRAIVQVFKFKQVGQILL